MLIYTSRRLELVLPRTYRAHRWRAGRTPLKRTQKFRLNLYAVHLRSERVQWRRTRIHC